jgi:subtilisin family serine protease
VDAVNFSPNVHVLNNSWESTNQDQTPGRYSTTIRQAFAYAYKANRTSVVAMGNHQQTSTGVVAFPAGFDNVIAVGATDINDGIANFSAQGNHIDVSAPGVGILSTFTDGGYANIDGTSMAAPHVSGIASLLKGFNTNLSNDDIENLLRLSADDRGAAGFDAAFGAGRVNAERALNFLRAPFAVSQWTSSVVAAL